MKNPTSIFISTLFLIIKEDDDTPSPLTDALDQWENTFGRSSDDGRGPLIQQIAHTRPGHLHSTNPSPNPFFNPHRDCKTNTASRNFGVHEEPTHLYSRTQMKSSAFTWPALEYWRAVYCPTPNTA